MDGLMRRRLLAGEVHVWCSEPSELERNGLVASAQALLSSDEHERMRRFRFEGDRLTFLATRVLVRQVLSRYEPIAPRDWTFVATSHGRPEIARPSSALRFNVSNTSGLVVLAVTHRLTVGVDVESLSRPAPIEVADRFFAPAEARVLQSLPPSERTRCFFEFWTLKESYSKARGLGLAIPLDRFWFTLEPCRRPRLEIDPLLSDEAEAWHFAQLRPTTEHVIAVCVRRSGETDGDITLGWHRFG
ncbi:4'-phosphopantetheinyl transferase [Nitrospira japonica]|uniref:4'-phosphopantetheinyl transferase n=1 Tax=Nitrospira japonica TaxID=1325564 RepID=A0A1W1IAZ7_9BACT|nr:4'-phosphopantetheinyl transferase [Nitrospira japonica]